MTNETRYDGIITTVAVLILCVIILGVTAGVLFSTFAFIRYQRVQNTSNFVKTSQMRANNQTILNEIQISQTRQLIQVENQKAAVRIAEARGIAAAMDLIQAKLTPLYLQHEAVQAQLKMAGSPNHTQIYIPVGDNGIPLVRTINP